MGLPCRAEAKALRLDTRASSTSFQGNTGELAVATLFMNFAGSAARIFTSSQEVKEPIVMYSFIVSTILNGTLLVQVSACQ